MSPLANSILLATEIQSSYSRYIVSTSLVQALAGDSKVGSKKFEMGKNLSMSAILFWLLMDKKISFHYRKVAYKYKSYMWQAICASVYCRGGQVRPSLKHNDYEPLFHFQLLIYYMPTLMNINAWLIYISPHK